MGQLATVTDDAARLRLLDAIRTHGDAPMTLGDAVGATGLAPFEAERQLNDIVRDYECDLDVDEEGRLIYRFAPGLAARPDIVEEDKKRRRREALGKAFMAFFKAWTVAMVVVYFIIYVILIIAALVAASQNKSGGGGRGGGSRRSGGGGFFFWWYMSDMFGGSRRRRTRRRELERSIRKEGRDPYELGRGRPKKIIKRGPMGKQREVDPDKPTLIERTWYFLFGAAGIERTPLQMEKELVTYIRAKKGIISNADIVALLGVPYVEADHIGTRLVATYEGELDITDEGLSVYRFPNLVVSAQPEIEKAQATMDYRWQQRRKEHALRKHPSIVIPALNGFNLVLAFVTYFKLLPILGLSGFLPVFFLVIFPGTFSFLFYAVAFRRWVKERARSKRYERDNIRISITRLLFVRGRPVRIPGDEAAIAEADLGGWGERVLQEHAHVVADELGGEVVDRQDGRLEIQVPRIREELALVDRVRRTTDSAARIGRTVFSTREATEAVDLLAAEIEALEAAPA